MADESRVKPQPLQPEELKAIADAARGKKEATPSPTIAALEPLQLTESEAAELDAFRAKPSRAEGLTFTPVPTIAAPSPSNEPAVEWVMCAVRDAMREHNFVVERGSDLWNRLRRHIEAALDGWHDGACRPMNDLLQQIAENEAFSRESRRLRFCKQCGRELSVLLQFIHGTNGRTAGRAAADALQASEEREAKLRALFDESALAKEALKNEGSHGTEIDHWRFGAIHVAALGRAILGGKP